MGPRTAAILVMPRGFLRGCFEADECLVPGSAVPGLIDRRRERGADNFAKLRERRELAEPDRLHEQVADLGRLDGTGQHRQPHGVGRSAAQEAVARAAADEVHLRRCRTRRGLQQLDRLPVLQHEALEDAADDRAVVLRYLLPGRRTEVPDAGRYVAGGEKHRIVGIDERTKRPRLLGQRHQLCELPLLPLRSPRATALVEQPKPADVAQQPRRAANAALVRQVCSEGGVVDQRSGQLHADERPGAAADVDRVRAPERHGGDSRTGVVRRRSDEDGAPQSGLVGNLVEEAADDGRRRHSVDEEAERDPEPLEEVDRPRLRLRVEALARARVGQLARGDSAEPVVEEIGDQEQRLRCLERRILARGHGEELEDRVDRHQLDPGALVQLPRGDELEHPLHHPFDAPVAVVDRVLDEPPRPVEEREVHAPCVDADRVDLAYALVGGCGDAREDPVVEPEHVPVERLPDEHGNVREPADLVDREPLAVEASERDATALRPDVDGHHRRHRWSSPARATRSRPAAWSPR